LNESFMLLEPRTTTAAILVKQCQPLVVDEIQLPEALEAGQVLVEIRASGICGAQLGEIDGVKGADPHLPHLLGHEGGGIVRAIGPGVSHVASGDHVVLHWRAGQGIQSAPPRYRWRGQPLNAGWVTTFNGWAVVSENRLTRIAPEIDFGIAALMGCAVTTGLGVVNNNARLKLGQSLVVLGTGGVGLVVVQGAALAGGCPIVAIDMHVNRLALAQRLGATDAVIAGDIDLRDSVCNAVGRAGADVVVETTGHIANIELAYELTHSAGTTVLVGVPRRGERAQLATLPLHFRKTLTGSHGGETVPHEDIPRYLRLYQAGKLNLNALITNRYPLSQINQAISDLRSGQIAGRCMIDMPRELQDDGASIQGSNAT
jgi:S-(hydroxymethyl)glutathione dehydrogenase/alcohol dehydrogenase